MYTDVFNGGQYGQPGSVNLGLFRPGSEPGTVDTSSQVFITDKMLITPELASALLLHNKNNRNLRPMLVRQYAEDMRQGNFHMTHQGIAFYENGDLADGQHRLHAIVESGVSVWLQVTIGEKVTGHIDIGAKRTELDALRICNPAMSWANSRAVAMVNILKSVFPGTGIVTLTDKQAYLAANRTAFEFALDTYRGTVKNLCSSAISLAFAMAYMDGVDPMVLKSAAGLLATGMLPDAPDPASNTMLSLRNYLQGHSGRSGSAYNKQVLYVTAHMLNRYVHGQSAVRVSVPTKFPFGVYDMDGVRSVV